MSEDNERSKELDSMILGLVSGDDVAYAKFWERYGEALRRVAQKHLPQALERRLGAEDLVQSVCRSFFRRATAGEYRLSDSEDLWRLMCGITVTKSREKLRHHLAQKRALNQEVDGETHDSAIGPLGKQTADAILPVDEVAYLEQFDQIMEKLDSEERQIVGYKLDGHTNSEIAAKMQCAERTVRRIMNRVRSRLSAILQESVSQ